MYIKLHRLGARRSDTDIEPSCGVMDIMHRGRVKYRIVTDCGLTPTKDKDPDVPQWRGPDLTFFEDGKSIDLIRLTHVHGDHVGLVPALVPYLDRKAKVMLTKTSADLLYPVLLDGYRINERRRSAKPFTEAQMNDILRRQKVIMRPGEVEIFPGITDYIQPEGHIGGACSFTTRVRKCVIHNSGDRCSHDQPMVRGAAMLPKAWRPRVISCSDCTYGADPTSDGRNWQAEMERLTRICRDTMDRGGVALVHTFGIHRAAAIAHELQRRGLTRNGRVHLDGSCRNFTARASQNRHWSPGDTDITTNEVMMVDNRGRNELLADSQRGLTVITTPGMGGPGGAATWWRRHVMTSSLSTMIYTGYTAPGTDGDKVISADHDRRVAFEKPVLDFEVEDRGRTHTETYPLLCQVAQVRLSGHDSQSMILDWFRDYSPEVAVLNHGSKLALETLEAKLGGDILRLIRADLQQTVEVEA